VLFDNIGDANFREKIRDTWREVAEECSSMGHPRFTALLQKDISKIVSTLRDDLWGGKKTQLKRRYDGWMKTGQERHDWKEVITNLKFNIYLLKTYF
jgi:hypothetical protein